MSGMITSRGPQHIVPSEVPMGSPRAVFAALDEHESGWLAEADLGTALERAGG